MTRCCVPQCSKLGTHHFPKDDAIRKHWIKAIRRKGFVPKESSRLCRNHFVESDYEKISKYTGLEHQHRYLKKCAVPSIFPWNTKPLSEQAQAREDRLRVRNIRKRRLFEDSPSTSQGTEEIAPIVEANCQEMHIPEPSNRTCGTQTSNILRLFSTELLLTDDESVYYYTGLETYAKFTFVLSTLLPMAYEITYRWSRVVGMSIEDQFLILLIKLRRNKPDFELSKMFGVSKTEISNIVVTWINFVADIWSLLDTWPSRELVKFYMPKSFRKDFYTTRVIVDGTEIPIQTPGRPDAQKSTFSSYKHKNTLKFLVGASPGGLITYCSGGYAGSASDRQIVERSNLPQMCEEGDSIMADRGFNVQDLFASKGIGINIPTFLKGKSQIPGVLLKMDQKLARQRVHIERLRGLTKTYKILTCDLNQYCVPLATKIFKICIQLCNFREAIVNKNK
ncbi:uncharacterized protein LOC125490226 [Plutella xylostella]|uniref:uncharacterized protein LOC125490226 n=1 Tax=Plutella xylostella TaxID=51655 RepID=UPI0020324CFD|nr:uncharacterized protein LOC125490226 [Plutella xylostella]